MSEQRLKYRISSHLADGGMASLERIVLENGMPAVLRELQKCKIFNFSCRERFKAGARIRERLSPHPNIVNSKEIGWHGFFQPYEIIDFVDGVPLRNLMSNADPNLKANTNFVIREMAEALAWVHDSGIMHLDVKPENFLMRRRGNSFELKLTDFDLSREKNDHGPRKQLGTPGFMAPEQFLDKLSYQASDVFAFGLIAYQLLTGKFPFAGKTPKDTWRHQASSHHQPRPIYELAPNVDPQIECVVNKCLMKPLAARYENMSQVLQDLRTN